MRMLDRLLGSRRRTHPPLPPGPVAPPEDYPHPEANGPYSCTEGESVQVTRRGSYAKNAWHAWWLSGKPGDPESGPYVGAAAADITIPYPTVGDYTLRLRIKDDVNDLEATDYTTVRVAPAPEVDHLTIEPPSLELIEGHQGTLTAHAWTADGYEVMGQSFAWESDDPSIATVEPSGQSVQVTALVRTEPMPPPPVVTGTCNATVTLA